MTITLAIIAGLSLIGNYILYVMLRGAISTQEKEIDDARDKIHSLSGREIETIRRRVATVGMRGIKLPEVFSLILSLREIQKGVYTDEDPWVPSNPYEDIDLEIDELPEK